MKTLTYNCVSCEPRKSRFKFCSGICDLPEGGALVKIKNKEIQFLNDNHDVELFCKLSNARNYFNHYYTGENEFSETPFDMPIIRISKIKKSNK